MKMLDPLIAQQIGEIMSAQLEKFSKEFSKKMDEKLDARFAVFEAKMDEKLDTRFAVFEAKMVEKLQPIREKAEGAYEAVIELMKRNGKLESDIMTIKKDMVYLQEQINTLNTKVDQMYQYMSEKFAEINWKIEKILQMFSPIQEAIKTLDKRVTRLEEVIK